MTFAPSPVVDDAFNNRFLVRQDGVEAELTYHNNGRRLVLIHTGVPDAIGGRGIGGQLVRAALERARSEGLTLVPLCPYAREWLKNHPDDVGAVAIDWRTSSAEPSDQRTS